MACSTGLFIALFTEANTPSELAGTRALALPGENVPERQRGGRKGVGLAVRQTWAYVLLSRRGYVTLSTDPLWALVSSPSRWGHAFFFFLSQPAGCPLPKNMSRKEWAGYFLGGQGCFFIEVKCM